MSSDELPDALHTSVQEFCRAGDALAEEGSYEEAVAEYNRAWGLIPGPKNHWNAATWILAAIADACFLSGYQTSAREALEYAMTCPQAVGNPFLHLRYGQVLFDQGELDRSADELVRAYMGGGSDVFAAEDPRYISFLRSRAKLD
jgi:hypothetical protein